MMVESFIAGILGAALWALCLYGLACDAHRWIQAWRERRAHERLLDELWNDVTDIDDDELARSA